MSKIKEKEMNSNIKDNQKNKKSLQLSYSNLDKNNLKEKSKSKTNLREKDQSPTSFKMKFSYIPKSSYANNNNRENMNNNILDSKSSIVNIHHPENFKNTYQENQNNQITMSNKIEKNKIPIFDKKLLIKNKEKANTKKGKNYVIIKEIQNNRIVTENNNNNYNYNKGFFLITTKSKRVSPIKYQLNLDNNNDIINHNNYNNNNSFVISKNSKYSPENKTKIIKFENKINYTNNNLDLDKGKIITLENISIIKDNKNRNLKKCLSKPNCVSYSTNDNNNFNNRNNNFIHNILYNNKSNEKFNFEKYKKQQHITSTIKNNNLHSYQIQAPPRSINHSKKNSTQQTHTINLKNININNNIPNYQKVFSFRKKSYQNLIQEYIKRNQNPEIRSKSRSEAYSREIKIKNQINNNNINNNININNVCINLDSINDDNFNSTEDKSLIKEQLQINKRSYSNSYIKLNNKHELNISNNQMISEIKALWKKIGGINEQYKINFIEKINYLNPEDKLYLYLKEKEDITNLLNILEKLKKNIEKRKSIHLQIKNIGNLNNSNYIKIEDISKLLINLRMSSINIIKEFIKFKKEISYDVMNNKYNLVNILHFPYNCLTNIENDSTYLSAHEYLSSLFNFSKYPDPFLILPSKESKDINKNYYVLPINNYVMKEIQKANYFLIKEKMCQESLKKNTNKSFNNFNNNNTILIRNIIKTSNSNKNLIKKINSLKNSVYSNTNSFSIINNEIKQFNKDKIKFCPNISDLYIINDRRSNNNNIIPCFNILNYEYNNNKRKNLENNFVMSDNNHFEIIRKYKNKDYLISNQINNFEIIQKNNEPKYKVFNNILICNNINNLEIKDILKNKINNNFNKISTNNINQNKINIDPNSIKQSSNVPNQNQIIIQNMPIIAPNQIVCPYNPKTYPPIDILYKAYLGTVSNDIKISFKIMPDIHHYLSIGVSPKIILFKENNSFLYAMATLSYDPSQLYKKSLVITSISCSNNYSITKTLLQLVDYCNKQLEYDELILYLYFYENESKKGEYFLNEEYKNMIKSQTLFKWTALENSGNERKIKYHYKKSFDKNYKENKNAIKILNNYIHIKFYRFIKYNSGKCEFGLNTKEYTYLFNIFDLICNYGININDKSDELNMLFTKLVGLKKKRLLKIITEFNYPICNLLKPFFEQLSKSEDKLYSDLLLKRFIGAIQNMPKDKPFHSLGFFCCDISSNFSSIIKRIINGFEYNIISINEFNIETFRLNNDKNNEDYNNYIYFFKSQNESISFLVYELNLNEENNMINNVIDYRSKMFYKLLKRILTKDNDEPVKLYKKIVIPSFKYYVGIDKDNLTTNKIADYEILDGNDWFNFCIENNNPENLFSFPEENIINEDIKIINNSFIIAIINPELAVDYHIPALNIYYINKNCWIKR